MNNQQRLLSEIWLLLIICIMIGGCVGTTDPFFTKNSKTANPESGIVNWMTAMNAQDAERLYQLSPEVVKKQINREDFLAANAQNALFLDNITFVDYSVINITQTENIASVKAQLVMAKPDPSGSNITYSPIFYTFNEFYEDNEWKVWAS